MDIGAKIKKLRKEKGLTLADVAKNQMTGAMLSLIENGKSKPSADKLSHIAKQLGVEVSELLGTFTNDELRKELSSIEEQLTNWNLETFQKVIRRIQNILPHLGTNFESARIYEVYSKSLFNYYKYYKPEYDQLDDGDWTTYANRAKDIYHQLEMENRVLRIQFFLALTEEMHGNYQKALHMIDQTLANIQSKNRYENLIEQVDLMLLKMDIYVALGDFESGIQWIEKLVQFCNDHLVLNRFFEIHNKGTFLYYNQNDFNNARKYVDKIETFFQLIENKMLFIDKEIIIAHYLEFFENQPEESLKRLEAFEKDFKGFQLPNEMMTESLHDIVSDLKARCYTKLSQPEKALTMFRKLITDETNHLQMHPSDVAIREISKSYQAQCYIQLDQKEEAKQLADEGVRNLRKYPHTTYYQYARDIQLQTR